MDTRNTCRCQQSLASFAATLSLLPWRPPSSLRRTSARCSALLFHKRQRPREPRQTIHSGIPKILQYTARTLQMRCHHRGSSAATQQEQEQQRHQWRRHLLYGPMLIALAILDFSAASRWTNVPASPQSSRGAIQRVAPARSALVGRLGVRVRGGAIQSVEEEGEAQEVRHRCC